MLPLVLARASTLVLLHLAIGHCTRAKGSKRASDRRSVTRFCDILKCGIITKTSNELLAAEEKAHRKIRHEAVQIVRNAPPPVQRDKEEEVTLGGAIIGV